MKIYNIFIPVNGYRVFNDFHAINFIIYKIDLFFKSYNIKLIVSISKAKNLKEGHSFKGA